MNYDGLTEEEVAKRVKEGKINKPPRKKLNSTGQIIIKNTFTIFNLVNIVLAAMIIMVGSYKNLLFIFIAIANTLISIINGIRAKRIVDKMKLISEQKPTVIRNGKHLEISSEDIVKDDLIIYGLGDQVVVDAKIKEGKVEVNESFISGEQNNIVKGIGDELISGSFIVSGTCKAEVTSVGVENFVTKLEQNARTIKTADSELFKLMNNIVKYISYALIPIGALVLWARFRVPGATTEVAVTSTVAALINMIPEGLILLTSSVLALATIRLSRKKVLVQDLYSIETLARVDCICLDKTGTLTTGKMVVEDLMPAENIKKESLESALKLILSTSETDNATSMALKQKLMKKTTYKPSEEILEVIPFSSERKHSGVRTKNATFLMGAAEFITKDKGIIEKAKSIPGDYRVITVVKVSNSATKLLGFALLKDELRKDAKEIINYFYDNDVDIKIISGDNLKTVENIAKAVGFKNPQGVDFSSLEKPNYERLVKEYNIFTRVNPTQKKNLIKAFKKQGKTVAMTGDGVNDILAMKEADCSIAIGEGSDAARRSSKLVLLSSDFSAVPKIIDEGRQSINNLERSTSLFLAKTVYASILAVVFVFLPMNYPFSPIEMSLLNFACIGFPGLILALEHNTERVKNRFMRNILTYSFPIGLTVSICMISLSIIAHINNFSRPELTTASVFITFIIDLVLIYWISRPLNKLRTSLMLVIICIMALVFGVPLIRNFFEFSFLTQNGLIVVVAILVSGLIIFEIMRRLMLYLSNKLLKSTT